jgi:hypothetical protein
VVAPDFFIRNQIELLKTLVSYCEGHTVLILCQVPRYTTFRCCDDPNHCTNFDDPAYLSSLLNDLTRIRTALTQEIPSAVVLDTLEVLIGQGEKDFAAKEEVINSCWSQDPVHANLHTYFKLASNTIQIIEGGTKTGTSSGKRQRATSSADPHSQSGPGSGHGSGSGSGDGSAPKRQKTLSKSGYSSGNMHGSKSTTAVAAAAAAAGRDPAAAAAAVMTTATTTGTTQAATTAAATSDRGETNMTVLRRHTTTDFGETPEGGDSKDAAPTAAAAAAATEHRQCSPDHNSYPDGKQKKR